MSKFIAGLSIFLLICFSASAQNSAAEKYVNDFSVRKNQWLIQKNYDSLNLMLDKRCLYMHSNGWIQSADEVIQDLKSGKLVYKKMEITESTARQFESMVIVTGKGNFEGLVNDKAFNLKLMYTEVYVKRKASWKLVTRQSTKLE
jgi:hypothetical protein